MGKPCDFALLESGVCSASQTRQQCQFSGGVVAHGVATRQNDRHAMSVLSLALMSWMESEAQKCEG